MISVKDLMKYAAGHDDRKAIFENWKYIARLALLTVVHHRNPTDTTVYLKSEAFYLSYSKAIRRRRHTILVLFHQRRSVEAYPSPRSTHRHKILF
jgi:hypothetical protein